MSRDAPATTHTNPSRMTASSSRDMTMAQTRHTAQGLACVVVHRTHFAVSVRCCLLSPFVLGGTTGGVCAHKPLHGPFGPHYPPDRMAASTSGKHTLLRGHEGEGNWQLQNRWWAVGGERKRLGQSKLPP